MGLTDILGNGVGFLVDHSLLPLTAVPVKPAKVLFLNNAINHGVFTPIGTEQAMLERNASFPVAIGSHVAIPHGTNESRDCIRKTGLVVMTYPDGIIWGEDEELVRLVIGIASKGEEHLDILNRIVEVCESEEDTDALVNSATAEELYKKLNGLA